MRILIIEDDKKVASFIERGLREEGYAVDAAHDGIDGSMKAHVYDYDLLVVDVMLPGKTGFELSMSCARSARRYPSSCPLPGTPRRTSSAVSTWVPTTT